MINASSLVSASDTDSVALTYYRNHCQPTKIGTIRGAAAGAKGAKQRS
jgi:hypothetical protein